MKCKICKKEKAVRDGFCAECFIVYKTLLGENVDIVNVIDGGLKIYKCACGKIHVLGQRCPDGTVKYRDATMLENEKLINGEN